MLVIRKKVQMEQRWPQDRVSHDHSGVEDLWLRFFL